MLKTPYLSNHYGQEARAGVESGEYAGWFVTPYTRGVPTGILDGHTWAGDNGCFSNAFTPIVYLGFLKLFKPYREQCLFIVAPDVLGNWQETLYFWGLWQGTVKSEGFPVGFVAQDDQPANEVPWDELDVYFVGGTNKWKDSKASHDLVSMARDRGKRVHVGRVNTARRLKAFFKAYRRPGDSNVLPGFTCDGGGLRYPDKINQLASAFKFLEQEIREDSKDTSENS